MLGPAERITSMNLRLHERCRAGGFGWCIIGPTIVGIGLASERLLEPLTFLTYFAAFLGSFTAPFFVTNRLAAVYGGVFAAGIAFATGFSATFFLGSGTCCFVLLGLGFLLVWIAGVLGGWLGGRMAVFASRRS